MIEISYIYHDCFIAITNEAVLIFDFWKNADGSVSLPAKLKNICPDIPVYVFISHSHKDHFNPAVFSWAKRFHNIKYIISRDVRRRINHVINTASTYKGDKVDASQVIALFDNDHYEDKIINVDSFPSTDIGNSYAITLNGLSIFHAGDLNAWLWKDESTEEEVRIALKSFNTILDKIAIKYSEFDLAFFPVDSRIGTDYFIGAKFFLNKFKVNNFFPMHFELADTPTQLEFRHSEAAHFSSYASHTCHHYIKLSPDSLYAIN